MTIKVLHINTESEWRGGERQVLLQMIHSKKEVENHLICKTGSPLFIKANKLGFITIGRDFRALSFNAAIFIWKLIKEKQIDIVHCHTAKALTIGALIKLMGVNTKLIYTKRTIFPIRRNFLTRFKYKISDLVVCLSDVVQRCVLTELPLINTVIIPDGIEIQKPSAKISISMDIPSLKGQKIVGNVGALEDEKDPNTFLRTAKLVTDKKSDVAFVWIGIGNLEHIVRNQIVELGLQEKVFLLGFKENIGSWIGGLDVLFFPSKSEGLGSTVLDAFLYEVPVVASNAGGLDELIQDGKSGLKSEIGDSEKMAENIISLLDNVKLGRSLSKNAFRTLGKYDIKKTTKDLISIYQSLTTNA